MTVVALWFVSEWRNRWRSLVGLMLLIAFATGGVVAATAGARRGASAVDRLLENSLPATVAVLPNQGAFDWDAVRAMPEVEAVTAFVVSGFGVEGLGDEAAEVSGFPSVDDDVWRTIERPSVLDGRLPDPSRADEVVVTTNFVEYSGEGVGDELALRLYSPEQIDAFDEGPPAGPVVDVTIVGVIRSGWYSDQLGAPVGAVFPSPGLYAAYAPSFVGNEGSGNINALVRLRDRGGVEEFEQSFARVSGMQNVEMFDLVEAAEHIRNVSVFEARALLLLAAAAAGASVLLLGLAVSRFSAVSFQNLEVLRAFGLSPAQTRCAVVAAPFAAATGGAMLGVGVAAWASRWFPIGSAALIEPAPGVDSDWLVFATAVALVVALVVALCLWSARSSRRSPRQVPATGGTIVASATSSWPLRVGMGTRLALEGGGSHLSTSGRSALVAAFLGVTGVVAALTFSAGVADATDGYERFGQTFDLGVFLGVAGEDMTDSAADLEAIAADPDVDGVNDAYNDVAGGDHGPVSLYTYDPVGAPIDVVVTDGRLPTTPSEIALAPVTADAADIEVGDTITLSGTIGSDEFTVTGIAFIPAGPHNGYAEGGWVLPEAFDRMFDGFRFHFGLVSTVPGVDPTEVAERVGSVHSIHLWPGPIIPPIEREELLQLQTVPLLLAGFLALMGVGAIAHTLASTARRRRHDFAMLRALGMRPRDTSIVIALQATVIAVASLALGIPLGIALGRMIWRSVAFDTPVQHFDPTQWGLVGLICVVVVGIALLLAIWPSRRLASVRLGHVLRYE